MKVIQLLPELESGGVERGTLEVGRFLAAEGHESVVISRGGRLVAQLEGEGSRHIALPVHRKSPASLLQVGPLRRLMAAERPDIVHARSRVPAWLTFLAWRGMDPATRPKFITTVHGFNSVNAYSRIMTRGERVICVSQAVREFVLANYPGVEEHRLAVVPRGIDPAAYPRDHVPDAAWIREWHAEFPQTRGKTLLVLPGRLTRLKGHADFLQLLKELLPGHPGLHGLIVGEAHPRKQDYRREVEARLAELGLGGEVTLTGHRSDLREILAHADLTFSLSQQPESFGRTVLESLALGTPVIGYDYGGVGEILHEVFPAGAVPPRDPAALAATTERFLTERPKVPPSHPFTLQRMLDGVLAVYREVCAGAGAARP